MSNRCDKCKYWDVKDPDSEEKLGMSGFGVCTRAIPFWEATDWEKDDSTYGAHRVFRPGFENRKFFAQDGSDFCATLMTAGDFYCAEFSDLANMPDMNSIDAIEQSKHAQ